MIVFGDAAMLVPSQKEPPEITRQCFAPYAAGGPWNFKVSQGFHYRITFHPRIVISFGVFLVSSQGALGSTQNIPDETTAWGLLASMWKHT